MRNKLKSYVNGYWVAPDFDTDGVKQIFLGSSIFSYDLLKEKIKSELGLSYLLDLTQVHGDEIVNVRDALHNKKAIEADGFYVDDISLIKQSLGLIIKTADCVPVIMRSTERVAIVHAGWRGLAAGIVEKALSLVDDGRGELRAAIGPCICQNCFEVDSDVYLALGGEKRGEKYYPDLVKITAGKILAVAPSAKISESGICTKCSANFNSYRRDKKEAGRNIALIKIN